MYVGKNLLKKENDYYEKSKKSFLFVLTFALSAIISCFALNALAAEDLQFSNASVEITFTENNGKHEVDDTFTVSGSFVSSAASDKKYYAVLTESGFDDMLRSVYVSDKYAISEGENTFTWDVGVVENANKLKVYVWTEDMLPICEPVEKLHSIRILAIGNSFSVDAEEYLYELLSTQDFNKVIVGNMYIGGCSLEKHWTNASGDLGAYTYYRKDTHITGGAWKKWGSKKLGACIQDKYWDFFTLQQASPLSGMPDSYEPYLTNLIDYVNENKTNKNAKILWHMTWAYESDSSHSGFANYNKDQLTMYNAIVDTMKSKVYPHSEIEFCIPAGTAIQNVRTSFLGDTLTRDGYHLSYTLGRYIAGLTWYNKITGFPIDDITYVPDDSVITKNHLKVIKECVKNAIASPEEITNSEYDNLEDFYDLANDYFELNWEPTGSAYWWSVKSINTYTTADNSIYFIASKKFTKEELPNGTLIVVDDGYQYRPEGWQTIYAVNTSDRPGNVTDNLVVITDDWWGDFTIRAFNVAVEGGKTNISSKVEEVASHFRIYVPNSALTETDTTVE